ncbi:MAG: DUF302 domain-containing protein [Gammaproteobacteria bacterium]|nr:DUF302 domain-containing protein [Gammaproteobacteria bacterium]MDH5735607.1 DUF302 domain-containing protein [Gammaproteobacteria bacterium]
MNNINKSEMQSSTLGRWIKNALVGSALVGLTMGMATESALAGNGYQYQHRYGNDGFPTITPFSRVARLPAVRNSAGEVDHKATYARARAASLAIATYVARIRESDTLGRDVIRGIDWKLGGTSETCLTTLVCSDEEIDHNVIAIPSPEPIDPNDATYLATGVVTPANTKKGNVVEFCNKKYASMAMGVEPIVDTRVIVNGYAHAPALPCEVSVWNDDEHIYVDMLDPSAIFTLFFSDVLFSADMQDPVFADALNAMPPQVKAEIVAIIHAALSEFDPNMKAMDQKIGPKYKSINDVIDVVASSPLQSPYLHMVYTKQDNGIFTDEESRKVAQTIINTMSIHGNADAGTHSTVINADGDTLDSILSPKSSWRSARIEPITIPGKNHIIEACSPKYAKMAMGTGLHHVNALPCEITVKTIDGGKKLVISYLDPAFMLGAMFADISDEDKAKFAAIPGLINDDLQKIVAAALDVNLGISLNAPVRKVINMLP